ncbi:putative aminotransferase [Diplogelasinospora grovesii]|uniref:Aminotransferase n=1 Tax=Diplogelasinospora grovesii TaxID=303347 RepID=A0AAN6S521_9PEZI|nr:putative aminotransferase [Diplogelasinospora grovesii]
MAHYHNPSSITDASGGQKLINLVRGWPSPHLLPADLLKRAASSALTDPGIFVPGLQYGPDVGYEPLRRELAVWLARNYTGRQQGEEELERETERLCITGGASQSVACILQSFTDPGYTEAIWLVAPCYFLACPIFEDAGFGGGEVGGKGGRLRAVPEDEEGIDVEFLEREIKRVDMDMRESPGPVYKNPGPHRKLYRHIVYVVPTCANPSGKTMPLKRREALVRLAREHDALVICDDVYDFLQWPTALPATGTATTPTETVPVDLPPPLPRLSDIDLALGRTEFDVEGKHFGHAISNGSFSKLVGPGVRTGWVHGTADFAHGLSQTGSTRSGGAPSQLCAVILTEMLKNGDLDEHLRGKVRPDLQGRHSAIVREVEMELGGCGVEVYESKEKLGGGYFVWLTLPEGTAADEVAQKAKTEENLIIAPGSIFQVARDEEAAKFDRNIRLCYSWEERADVVEGVRRLGRVLRRMYDERKKGEEGEEGRVISKGGQEKEEEEFGTAEFK